MVGHKLYSYYIVKLDMNKTMTTSVSLRCAVLFAELSHEATMTHRVSVLENLPPWNSFGTCLTDLPAAQECLERIFSSAKVNVEGREYSQGYAGQYGHCSLSCRPHHRAVEDRDHLEPETLSQEVYIRTSARWLGHIAAHETVNCTVTYFPLNKVWVCCQKRAITTLLDL